MLNQVIVDAFTGVMYSNTVVYSANTPTDDPVQAVVTCTLKLNGTVTQAATFSGTAAVAGVVPIQFPALWTGAPLYQVCTTVNYTSNATPTQATCRNLSTADVLPEAYRDVLTPSVCPVLGPLAPGIPGIVDIDPTGDVFLLGAADPVWDCPPYRDTPVARVIFLPALGNA